MPGPLSSLPPLGPTPLVSVVIPALNEEPYLGMCLASIEAQTYPLDRIEVLVVDAQSQDRTRSVALECAARRSFLRLEVLDNPDRRVAAGLNRGVESATGEVIVILGAHASLDPRFIEENVRALRETGAAATGGPIRATGRTETGRAIAAALSHPFGVGDARFRFSEAPGDVDTIAFAAYRRECFETLGGFEVDRDRGEDDHFNYLVRRAGGQLYLTPLVRSTYFSRSTYGAVARQYWGYGRAKGRAMLDEPGSIRLRHRIPLAVLSLGAVLLLASPFVRVARLLLAACFLLYGALATYAARAATSRRDEPSLTLRTASVFPVVHISYALGVAAGIIGQLFRRTNEP